MSIRYYVHPELRLRLAVYSGRLSRSDIERFAEAMRTLTAEQFSYDAVLCFDDDINLSGISADDLLDLEDAMSEAAERAGGVGELRVAAVTESSSVVRELKLWREIVQPASAYRYRQERFASLEAEVAWLGHPVEEADKIRKREGFRPVPPAA